MNELKMLHISELQVLLDSENLEEFSKQVSKHFLETNTDDVVSANKVINLISVHIFYKKCTIQVLKILSTLFTQSIQVLACHKSLVEKPQVVKAYQAICYVLDKGLFPAGDVEMIIDFNSQIKIFLTTYKVHFCSSKNHDVFFQRSIQLACDTKKMSDVNRVIKSALITYVSGVEVNNGSEGHKNFSVKISLIKNIFRSKEKVEPIQTLVDMEHSGGDLRNHKENINNVLSILSSIKFLVSSCVSTIEEMYSEGAISLLCYVEVLSLRIFLMDVTLREFLSSKKVSETSLKTIETYFQESWKLLDKVPKEKYHNYSKYFEGVLHLSVQVASKLYNIHTELPLVRQLMEKNVETSGMFKKICPEVIINSRLETAYTLLIYTLTDLKEFDEAMKEVARAISSFPSSSHYNFVKNFTSVKIRALRADHSSKSTFLYEIIKNFWPETLQEEIIETAKLEMLCLKNYGELLEDRKQLVRWMQSVVEPYSIDSANVLIEECLIAFFDDETNPDNTNRADKAMGILNDNHHPDSESLSYFRSVAVICSFLVNWKNTSSKLNENLANHKSELAKKPKQQIVDEYQDEVDTSDIRPYEGSISWSQEDGSVNLLVQALQLIKSLPSKEVISMDGWIKQPQHIVNVACLLTQLFALVGTEKEYADSLMIYLDVSDKYGCIEDKCLALLDLGKTFGSHEKAKESSLSALKSDTIGWSQEKPKQTHLRVGLGCAWSLYHAGDTVKALKICGQLLNHSGLSFNTDSLITTMGEIYYLAALSRQAGTSFQVSVNCDTLPDWCGGYRDFAIYGPLELCSIALTKFHEAGMVHQLKPMYDFTAISSKFRIMCGSIEASRLMSELVTRTGMPLEMKSRSVIFQDYCDKSVSAIRIVDGLLSVAEVNILFDKPDACNIKLLEVEKILKEVICDKIGSSDKGSKKAALIPPGTKDIGASPLLIRRKSNLPNWIAKHKGNCGCRPCNNPDLRRVVIKYFTLKAVSLYIFSDIEGGAEVFSKLESVVLKTIRMLTEFPNWGVLCLDRLLQACFESFRWRIEVLGRCRQFQECQLMLSLMEKTLKAMGMAARKKFPFFYARFLELKLSILDDLNDQKLFKSQEDNLSHITLKFSSNMAIFSTPATQRITRASVPRKPTKKIVIPPAASAEVNLIPTFIVEEKKEDTS